MANIILHYTLEKQMLFIQTRISQLAGLWPTETHWHNESSLLQYTENIINT